MLIKSLKILVKKKMSPGTWIPSELACVFQQSLLGQIFIRKYVKNQHNLHIMNSNSQVKVKEKLHFTR